MYLMIGSQQLSLLTRSPYPGVSTMLSRSLTLFSWTTARRRRGGRPGQRAAEEWLRRGGGKLTVRNCGDFGCLACGLIGLEPSLCVNQMRGEDRVDQGRLAQSSLTCNRGRSSSARVVVGPAEHEPPPPPPTQPITPNMSSSGAGWAKADRLL